jgi:acyl-coenzyme A synthetase/AMP-(fatty) acid ligase
MRKNAMQYILDHAQSTPGKLAIQSPGFDLTFDQLSGIVLSYGLRLQACGVTRRSTIAVRSADPAVVVASALAAALVGCGWVFDGEAMARANSVQVTHRFRTIDGEQQAADGCFVIDPSWTRPPAGHDRKFRPQFPGFAQDENTWMIFPSSGTTGTPKFMALSHETMLNRIAANAVEFPTRDEVCAFLFAVHSPPTLIRAICALTCGATLVLSADTEFWTDIGVTHVFGSPSQIKHVLPEHPLPVKIAKALIGGDFLPEELAISLLQSFGTVVNTYGSTEADLVVENEKSINAEGGISTHTVWRGSEIEIVDENDQRLQTGTEGIVRIRNGHLVPGYLNSPEAEIAAFRSGWFYPGDRGIVTEDRNFTVTGRTNDTFNLGGVKVNAALLDFVLQSIPGVEDAVCFMMPASDGLKELIALIRAGAEAVTPNIVSEARIQIATMFSTEATPAKFIFSDVIPRTENGKPDRAACVVMALARRTAPTR